MSDFLRGWLKGAYLGVRYGRLFQKKANKIVGDIFPGGEMRATVEMLLIHGETHDSHASLANAHKSAIEGWFEVADRDDPEMYEYLAQLCLLRCVEMQKAAETKPQEMEA